MTNSTETTPSIPDDWLSAYLDNELSDAERDDVEAALAESSTLRDQLDELSHVHDLLKSLSSPTLGQGFAKSLPLEPQVRRAAGLPWRFGMTAGSLVAASLVAGVLWIQSQAAREQFASRSGAIVLSEAASVAEAPMADSGDSPQPDMIVAADRSHGSFADRHRAAGAAAPMLEAEMGPASGGMGRASIPSAPFVASSVAGSRGLMRVLPRSGDLIPLLEDHDGNVTVVEWLVVDVDEAFGHLQVTLADLGVPEAGEDLDDDTASRKPGADGSGRFLAVFVEADQSVMESVLAAAERRTAPLQQQIVNTFVPGDDFAQVPSGERVRSEEADYAAMNRRRGSDGSKADSPAARDIAESQQRAQSNPQAIQSDGTVASPVDASAAKIQQPTKITSKSGPSRSAVADADSRASGVVGGGADAAFGAAGRVDSQRYAADEYGMSEPTSAYQVPVQISDESLEKIATANSITAVVPNEAELMPRRRYLIVFKPVM